MRDHGAWAVSTRWGTSQRPPSGSASGPAATSNVTDVWLSHERSIPVSARTGSGDSHMLGSAETSQRLACDVSRVVMRHDGEGRVVEIGALTRTIPPALRRALEHRDQGCRFPGCHGRFTQGHHLRHWAHAGPTTLSNLALPCRRHRRAVHEEGYQVARLPDGTLQFRRPNGHPLPEVPPPAAVPADPIKALRESHDAQGLRVHARTGRPSWLGEPPNVVCAIDVLPPRPQRGSPSRVET